MEALFWSVIGILMHGLTIIGVVYFDRWRTRVQTSAYDEEKNEDATARNNLTKEVTAAGLGFVIGLFTMISIGALGHLNKLDAYAVDLVEDIVSYLLWAIVPAVTGFFVQYYLDTAIIQGKRVWKLSLVQGATTAVMGTLIGYIVLDNAPSKIWYFLYYASITALLAGAGIGYVFPSGYQKKMERISFKTDRRENERKTVLAPAKLYIDESEFACNIVDMSAGGAQIDRRLRYPLGSKAQIDATNLGRLNSIIVRKSKKGTYLKFPFLPENTQKKLDAYIGNLYQN